MLLRTILEAVEKRQSKKKLKRGLRRQSKQQQQQQNASISCPSETKNKPLAYALARSWAWPALTFRCQTHPEEVAEIIQDSRGETILHWTCLGKPPIDTVQAILQVSPEMSQVRNVSGHLPLHVAISYRASVEVIRALLEVFPESAGLADGVGAHPLHLLCDYGSSVDSLRAVLETPTGAATIGRRMDIKSRPRTALEILNARMHYAEFRRALTSMREARKRQQTIRNDLQQQQQQQILDFGALVDAEHANVPNIRLPSAEPEPNADNRDWDGVQNTRAPTTTSTSEHYNAMLQRHERMIQSFQQNDYWQKAAMLILVEYTKQPLPLEGLHDAQANVVHACSGVSRCNRHLLEFAILLHQDDLIQKLDADGRLPLHVAAENHAASLLVNNSSNQSLTEEILFQILYACPKAAFVKDKNGMLPLAAALQVMGRVTPKLHGRSAARAWSAGLRRLLDANLSALETLNLDERLYPRVFERMTSPNELFLCIRRHPHLFQNGR